LKNYERRGDFERQKKGEARSLTVTGPKVFKVSKKKKTMYRGKKKKSSPRNAEGGKGWRPGGDFVMKKVTMGTKEGRSPFHFFATLRKKNVAPCAEKKVNAVNTPH